MFYILQNIQLRDHNQRDDIMIELAIALNLYNNHNCVESKIGCK